MLVECHYCLRRVLPTSSTRCPSCKQQLDDQELSEDALCTVLIRDAEPPVATCICCGRATDNQRRCTYARESKPEIPGHAAASIAVFFASLLAGWFVFLRRNTSVESFVIVIPQCDDCHKRLGNPRSENIDFELRRAKFDACVPFMKSLRTARATAARCAPPRSA